jgi:REP element-mobilizing transposase RayT
MAIFTIIRFIFDETDNYPVLCIMYRKKEREAYRTLGNGYYHFCTDGLKDGKLFNNAAEYAFGMNLMGMISISFSLKIYAFTLMPNHIHVILSGTGEDCLQAFDYLKRKLSARLKRDGYSPVPEEYWFKLTGITSPEQMKSEILYVLRNPLEKGMAMVDGYLWGSGWLYYSGLGELIEKSTLNKVSVRALRKLIDSHESVPEDWRFHPYLGLHPAYFVDTSLVKKLFPEAKDLQTAIVKDYELFFQIASRLGEICEFNKSEQESIVSQTLQKRFSGSSLSSMSEEDKGKLAIILHWEYGFNSYQISTNIFMKERVVRQLLASKELK